MSAAGGAEPGKALCVIVKPFGDSVCILPEIRWLAGRHGGRLDVLVKSRLQADLYRGLDYIGGIRLLEHWRRPFWLSPSQLGLLAAMRKADYGRIYLFLETDARKRRKFVRLLRRVGFPAEWVVEGFPEAEKAAFLDLPPGLPPAWRFSPVLEASGAEKNALRERLERECGWAGEPIVLLHPGNGLTAKGKGGPGSGDAKCWPADNWRRVMAGVAARGKAAIIVTGTARERDLAQSLIPAAANASNWAGKLAVRELIALQSLADSCIASDTGAFHSAAAAGCPTVGIFGPNDPRELGRCSPKGWGPTSTIRGADKCPAGGRSAEPLIRRIRPESVLRLWEELPPRRPDPAGPDCRVRHYYEGAAEPELLPVASF